MAQSNNVTGSAFSEMIRDSMLKFFGAGSTHAMEASGYCR
jgi:hypothetical protein